MELVTVQGDMQLAEPAASAWLALVADARATARITPYLSTPAGAWRSDAMVADMWRNPKKYGASKGTAKPRSLGGPGSVHENGLCVDINNWVLFGELAYVRGFKRSLRLDRLCAAHGFHPDSRFPNEPWHYQHNGTTPAGGGTDPFPEVDHALLRRQKEGIMFVHGIGAPDVAYEGFTDANGKFRLRTCSANQSAIVIGSGLSVQINDDRLTQLGVEAGGATPVGGLTITPKVDAQVTVGSVELPPGLATKADVDAAADAVAAKIPTAEQNGAAARAAIVK